MPDELIVGFVRGAHGLAGEFKVESASGRYEHIAVLKEVTLRHGDSLKVCSVVHTEVGNGTLYMKVAEINSAGDVRMYNGWELVVPRKYAAALEKDEWYIEDLKQCALIYGDKNTEPIKNVGVITGVLEGGGGYVLEVALANEGNVSEHSRKVFVPFSKKFVGEVNIHNKTIELLHLWILE